MKLPTLCETTPTWHRCKRPLCRAHPWTFVLFLTVVGSEEWWLTIAAGNLQLHTVTGVVDRLSAVASSLRFFQLV
jgi:hypothetical protein